MWSLVHGRGLPSSFFRKMRWRSAMNSHSSLSRTVELLCLKQKTFRRRLGLVLVVDPIYLVTFRGGTLGRAVYGAVGRPHGAFRIKRARIARLGAPLQHAAHTLLEGRVHHGVEPLT